MGRTIQIKAYYGSLKNMQEKFDRLGRKDYFQGTTVSEFEDWKQKTKRKLSNLLGMQWMESCPLNAVSEEKILLENGIVREKVILQTEPGVYMPMYILIPPKKTEEKQRCCIALPGHMGAGKYSVAGRYDIPAVMDAIRAFHYDYGMQLTLQGYVTICPDSRGFGERRDEAAQGDSEEKFLNSTCFQLAHMAEGLGETVIGMCTWDNMRLIDYIYERNEWDTSELGCVGFSGGGMQALWLSALDERIKRTVISGYLYGYKDSLMVLNGNCSCNYVPGLWRSVDMGDIASLIAPRTLIVQSCREDDLNGRRKMENVLEQIEIIQNAYDLYQKKTEFIHDVRDGGHCFHFEGLRGVFYE